ncbi:tetratricopeptide repeat protein [Sphingomonas sp.]|uniref:tetratricopeptide repeat protein n=1 Tax=Sphingomonas sp. TaxID=28214 RepID=UPI00286BDB63|nr:tetratricopeptide repeat protein [Sphingomonas sp.]
MRLTLLLLVGTSLLATAALANPGGSGGSSGSGGQSPSMSAPQFDAAAEYLKGVEALKASQFADAKKYFVKVLGVAPRDSATNYLAGLSLVGLDDLKGATKYFDKAVKADPKMVAARQDLAITLAKLGEKPKAEAELAKLKESQAKCAAACPEAGDLDKAIAAVSAVLAGSPQAQLRTRPSLLFESARMGDAAYLVAVGLINEGRFEAAIALLQEAKATFGAHPDILTYLGFANRKLGRYDIAEGYYRQALASAPAHRGATEYYGELMVERGNLKGAKHMLAKLEAQCSFGCAEADELRRWIDARHAPTS